MSRAGWCFAVACADMFYTVAFFGFWSCLRPPILQLQYAAWVARGKYPYGAVTWVVRGKNPYGAVTWVNVIRII